jgi:hypothetical protein
VPHSKWKAWDSFHNLGDSAIDFKRFYMPINGGIWHRYFWE